jgi:sorting nexin-29
MPDDWEVGLIVPLFKKDYKMKCENYRGITLLNVAYKILSRIILERLKEYSEEILGEYQCGFRPQKRTTDQIFVLRQILENIYAHDIDLHLLFIDFKKAFDSINKQKKTSGITSEFWDNQEDRTTRENDTRSSPSQSYSGWENK